ncbi:outer membrane lipoprotein-sorting protein [Planctomycetota bacterium]
MKVTRPILALLVVMALFGPASADDEQQELTGRMIMEKVDRLGLADDEQVDLNLTTVRKDGFKQERSLTLYFKAGEERNDKILVRFTKPADLRGLGLLTHERGKGSDQWLYLPDLRKAKRVAGASKSEPFVETAFSNYDIRTEDLLNHEYKLAGEETLEGRPCYVVESRSKDAHTKDESGYSRRIIFVDKERWTADRIRFYDMQEKPLKVLTNDDYVHMKGLWRAHRVVVKDVQQGSTTTAIYSKERKINAGLDDSRFSKRELGHW